MSPVFSSAGSRIHRDLGFMAASAAIIAAGLAWWRPAAILPAYRLALFLALAPAVGSMFFGLVHACTGGHWGESLRPFLAVGSRLAPWIWLGIIPLVAAAPAGDWPAYDGRLMLAL